MVELLIGIYAAICFVGFRVFKIPLNKWTVPGAILGGVAMISLIMLTMNYNHPFTKQARIYFLTTPIMSYVRGPIVSVEVKSNVPLKKGDVLFRVDPEPFEIELEKRRAGLADAEQSVKQLKSAVDAETADVQQAIAVRNQAEQAFRRVDEANSGARQAGRAAPFADVELENRRGTFLAAQAALASAAVALEQARLAYDSQYNGVAVAVAKLRADVRDAEYDLEQSVVRAPGPGSVPQQTLRPGMMALPLRPVMTFVHADEQYFIAAFEQNSLQRIRPGDEAEIAFDALPGQIVKGRVRSIIDAMAPGQIQPGGSLIDPSTITGSGRTLAVIDITDDVSAYNLPGGAEAQVALYTEYWHHFALIRRILLRMKSWQNYVFLEGH
jgi:multidrug resistance efflux pump